jgi:hypothetical protein
MDINQVRYQGLDKFYTNENIVDMCLSYIDVSLYDKIIEPSAGNGAFLKKLPINSIGIDISPEHNSIIKYDFLEWKCIYSGKILTIGNPPFGKNNSLSLRFFNKAAEYSDCIAFILPKTFRRPSIQNKLNLSFHLVKDVDIPITPCSFTPKMNVKCCFQVWEKKNFYRSKIILPTSHNDWDFLALGEKDQYNQPTPPLIADFAIRAYGSNCGVIYTENLHLLRPKSYHWIKSNIDITNLIQRFKSLDYSLSVNTARQNSIGRGELVSLYTKSFS